MGRRDELLGCAAELFVEKGYEATSMRDIADAVGILKGSLYYYIDSKEDLLTELTRRLVSTLDTRPRSRLDPLAKLRLTAHDALMRLLTEPVNVLAVTDNYGSLPEHELHELKQTTAKLARLFRRRIADGQRAGTICVDLNAGTCTRIYHGTLGSWHEWWFPNAGSRPSAHADAYADFLVAGLACDPKTHEAGHRGKVGQLPERQRDPQLSTDLAATGAALSETANRKEQLLQVAASLFVEKGYEATSMQDLADAVGILKGSLYYYTESKQDLLWELARPLAEGLPTYRGVQLEPLAKLRLYARNVVLMQLADNTRVQAVRRNHRALDEERREVLVDARDTVVRRVQRLITDGQRTGEVCADLEPGVTARVVLATVGGLAGWLDSKPGSHDRLADDYADLVVAAVACNRKTHEPGHRRKLGALPEPTVNGTRR